MKSLALIFLLGVSAGQSDLLSCVESTIQLFSTELSSPDQIQPALLAHSANCQSVLEILNQTALKISKSDQVFWLQIRLFADFFSVYDAEDLLSEIYAITTFARDLTRTLIKGNAAQISQNTQCLVAYLKVIGDYWNWVEGAGGSLEGAQILLDVKDVNSLCPDSLFKSEDVLRMVQESRGNQQKQLGALSQKGKCLLRSAYVFIDYMITMANINYYDQDVLFLHYADIWTSFRYAKVTCWYLF